LKSWSLQELSEAIDIFIVGDGRTSVWEPGDFTVPV
jgi:hypothetical protein